MTAATVQTPHAARHTPHAPKTTSSELAERMVADETVARDDKADLSLAHDAKMQAMRAYKDAPGKTTKQDLDAAKTYYEETVLRLARHYYPEDAPQPEGERFRRKIDALKWVRDQGYGVSQGKFYQDVKAGFPRCYPDGTVSKYQVMQYVQRLDLGRKAAEPQHDLAAEKEHLEVQKLRLEVQKRELENRKEEANWLDITTAWRQMGAVIIALKDALSHQFNTGSELLTRLAGGHHDRAPEVYEGAAELIARAFNEVIASGKIEGTFIDESKEQ